MGGKGGGSAPSPDPQIGQAALKNAQLGQEFLDWAKDTYGDAQVRQQDIDALNKQVIEQQMGIAQQQNDWAQQDRQRYEDVFQPVEDQFVDEATNYASPERQAQAAAEAKADVQSQAEAQRAATQRQQESMGVNPNSGRFQGVDRAAELSTAVAGAGAQNQARDQVRDKGLALKADVANLGRGLPAQSAQATSLGLGAASGAVGTAQSGQQSFLANTGIMGQGYGQAMAGYNSQASILNQQYQNQLNAWGMQQQAGAANTSGIFGALGTGLGLAFSSKKFKRDRKPTEQGLDAVNSMPIQDYRYKDGIQDGGEMEHTGAMAEDFQRATGKGDGTMIPLQDAIGVTMKAVQELDDKVDKLAAKMPGISGAGRSRPQERRVA